MPIFYFNNNDDLEKDPFLLIEMKVGKSETLTDVFHLLNVQVRH